MPKRVYWAVPLERALNDQCASSLLDVATRAGVCGFARIRTPYARTDIARNNIARLFMDLTKDDPDPTDTLIMLDNDHNHPFDILEQLIAVNEPVVGALAFRRGPPYDPCFYMKGDKPGEYHAGAIYEKALYRCDMIGHAAIAIQRRVLETLSARVPLWRYTYTDGDYAMPSEDVYFSETVRGAGIEILCDTRIVSPHYSHRWISEDTWQEWVKYHPEVLPQEYRDKRAADRAGMVSVIIPSKGRPQQLKACIQRLVETTKGHSIECIVVLDKGDTESHNVIKEAAKDLAVNAIGILVWHTGTAVEKWNAGAVNARGHWLVLAADDVWFGDGWLDAALAANTGGFVAFNDCHTAEKFYQPHFMMTREFMDSQMGGVLAIPHYGSWFTDCETALRARRAGVWVFAEGAIVEHRHPMFDENAPTDKTYTVGTERQIADERKFQERMAAGFPNDFIPLGMVE